MSATIDPQWHQKRARVVGGSEIAALYGCQQPYQMSLYTLWHVKAGLASAPPVDGERIEWGNDLEEAIARVVARRNGWTISKGGHVTDLTTPGLGCTLDYIIEAIDDRGPGALEIKNVDWLVHKSKWIDGEPPLHILLQLQTQLAATGYRWGYIACLVGGNQLETYEFTARPSLIADIRKRVTEFWASIERGEAPPIDGSSGAFHVLRELNPDPVDDSICLDESSEFSEICAELQRTTEERRQKEKTEEALKARVMQLVGSHRRAWGNGWSASLAITKANPGKEITPDMVGTIIGARKEMRRLTVKEYTHE